MTDQLPLPALFAHQPFECVRGHVHESAEARRDCDMRAFVDATQEIDFDWDEDWDDNGEADEDYE